MGVRWAGRMEDYPLENYPDYVPGKPPQLEKLHSISYLDEMERIWGRKWGGYQGIGKLREVALIKPTEVEINKLWEKDLTFFMMRFGKPDLDLLLKQHDAYAKVLEANGVKIHWMTIEDNMGAYGPMRKLYMASEVMVINGGAILSRFGHGSWKRGLNPHFQKFLTSIGCPILYMVHGNGICEVGPWRPVAENAIIGHMGSAANQDGIDQVLSVLKRNGFEEIHIAQMQTIMDTPEAGGEFHVDMVIGILDIRKAVVYPANLDYNIYKWFKEHKFDLVEIPPDEHKRYVPANLVTLEPGRVIMPAGAEKTIRAVRKLGVKVIEIETVELLKGGTNGLSCTTLVLVRDPGPSLND